MRSSSDLSTCVWQVRRGVVPADRASDQQEAASVHDRGAGSDVADGASHRGAALRQDADGASHRGAALRQDGQSHPSLPPLPSPPSPLLPPLPLYTTEEQEVMLLMERVTEAQRYAKMVSHTPLSHPSPPLPVPSSPHCLCTRQRSRK